MSSSALIVNHPVAEANSPIEAAALGKRNQPEETLTTNEDDTSTPSKIARFQDPAPMQRVRRKKCAVLISYSGLGYLGLQRNPGMKTIEEDILSAFLKGGIITEEGYNQPQSIQFQRAARTDKGVSAVRQVLSLKLPDEVDLIRVNESLPGQIRVVGVKRTTKGFNCKANCDARTYSYTMPSFTLAPPLSTLSSTDGSEQETYPIDYRLPQDIIDRTNQVLKIFLGTHNYHNFTSRRKPLDPSTQRYIISFSCEEPVVIDGMEFVTVKVKGQSFMLHQIRKMVGLVIAIVRGHTMVETITKAWQQDKLDLPVAPGLGLVLEEVHYDRYNQRYGKDGIHEPIEWSAYEAELESFRNKYITSTIVNTEKEEKSMLAWLDTLPNHSYSIRNGDRTNEDDEIEDEEDDDESTHPVNGSSRPSESITKIENVSQ